MKFEKNTLHFTSLGCSKNLVDSQVMLGHLNLGDFKLVENPSMAEIIIINTCSFIEAAKEESIEHILESAEHKKSGNCRALVVSGCMPQRYQKELERSLPEVDLFIGTGEYHKIVSLLRALEEGRLDAKSHVEIPKYIHTEFDPRMNTSPFYTAWLKVSEGCNRNCTFCIIPTLRGKLRSRSIPSLVEEAKSLVSSGVRELNIISQDLSDYGSDLEGENNLYELLKALDKIEGLNWIRLFYFYPDELTDEVVHLMADSEKICSYLDMPVQHFSDLILKKMNRKITGEKIYERICFLRQKNPDIALRTSVIVGFPGETEEDFLTLLEGVKKSEFNHLGIFRYSDEEGTPAYNLKNKVHPKTIDRRFDLLHETQREISRRINARFVGKTLNVLIEGVHEETDLLVQGRHKGQAPDIDGKVIINDFAKRRPNTGDIVSAKILESHDYDLVASLV